MIALLLIAGFLYATRDSWAALFKSYASDKRQGQNEVAWWGRELAHGFPHARHPFMNTWRAHQSATGQMREQRMRNRPGEIAERQRLREQIAEHRRLIEAARRPATPATTPTGPAQPAPGLPASYVPLPQPRPGGRRHRSQPATAPRTFRQPLTLVPDPSQPADTGWPGGVQPPPTVPCPHCNRKTFHMVGCPLALHSPNVQHPGGGQPRLDPELERGLNQHARQANRDMQRIIDERIGPDGNPVQPPGSQPAAGAPPASNTTCPHCGCSS
jgi:hypothetical protein